MVFAIFEINDIFKRHDMSDAMSFIELHWHIKETCADFYCAKAKQCDSICMDLSNMWAVCQTQKNCFHLFSLPQPSHSTWFVLDRSNVSLNAVIQKYTSFHHKWIAYVRACVCRWHTNRRMHDQHAQLSLEYIDKDPYISWQNRTKQQNKREKQHSYFITSYMWWLENTNTQWLARLLARLFVHSFARSFIHSLLHA